MNEKDIHKMFQLIKEYTEEEMDQWNLWKFDTKFGKAYISFDRKPCNSDETYDNAYHDISELIEKQNKS